MTNRQQSTMDAGFGAVADSNSRLVHKTDGSCWSDSAVYVPLGSVEEGEAHNYTRCNKCAGGKPRNIITDDDES